MSKFTLAAATITAVKCFAKIRVPKRIKGKKKRKKYQKLEIIYLVIADVLQSVRDDRDSHVDQIGRRHFEHLTAELFTVLVDFLPTTKKMKMKKKRREPKNKTKTNRNRITAINGRRKTLSLTPAKQLTDVEK